MKPLQRYTYSLWAMSRPIFLLGIVPLYALGVTAAWYDGKLIQSPKLVSGLFLVWLVQLMTHYNNEYYDLETDQATEIPTRISGGSRVLVRRLVPRNIARGAAIISLLLAIILTATMVIIIQTGLPTLAFAGAAVFLGWFYSAKPLKLEAVGMGEVTIVLVSCFLVPFMSYYLQTSIVKPGLLIVCVPPGLLTLALILATEIPDYQADKATGKITLAVRLGTSRAIWLSGIVLIAGWLAFGAAIIYVQPFWGWIPIAVSLPLLLFIGLNLRTAFKKGVLDISKVEWVGLASSLLVGYAGICLTAAFIIR